MNAFKLALSFAALMGAATAFACSGASESPDSDVRAAVETDQTSAQCAKGGGLCGLPTKRGGIAAPPTGGVYVGPSDPVVLPPSRGELAPPAGELHDGSPDFICEGPNLTPGHEGETFRMENGECWSTKPCTYIAKEVSDGGGCTGFTRVSFSFCPVAGQRSYCNNYNQCWCS